MSYILEALRRAQAERDRQGVPGLQAQAAADLAPPAPPHSRLALALAGGLLLGVAGLAGLWWWSTPQPAPATTAGPLAVPAPAVTPPPPAAQPAPPPGAAVPRLPVVVSAPPVPARPAAAAAWPAPAASAIPTTSAVSAVSAASAAWPAAPRVVRLAQLPAEQRRELPPLAVGGSVWSDSAASRFVILDGQLMREGDSVAPGLVLERIAPKSAWLRWRELRIELAL